MAYEIIEGFDLVGSNADLVRKGFDYSDGSIAVGEGRFGGNAYRLAGSSKGLHKIIIHPKYMTLSLWIKRKDTPNDFQLFLFNSNFQNLPSLYVWSNGRMTLFAVDADFPAPFFLDTDDIVLVHDTWHLLEFQVIIEKLGRGTVFIDGNAVLDLEANYYFDGFVNTVALDIGNTTGVNVDTIIDDLVIQTSDISMPPLLGEHRIHTLLPDSDTATAEWTGSYTDIDDPIFSGSDGDTTFISSSTLNAKSEFGFESLPEAPDVIYAVQPIVELRKDGGDPVTTTLYTISNAVRADDITYDPLLSASLTYPHSKSGLFLVDQDTGSPWTEASVNAIIGGVEITSTS